MAKQVQLKLTTLEHKELMEWAKSKHIPLATLIRMKIIESMKQEIQLRSVIKCG